MKGDDFKAACKAVGLSVYAAAPFLGMSLRQAQRIAAGEYAAPEAVAKLLRLMARLKVSPKDVK